MGPNSPSLSIKKYKANLNGYLLLANFSLKVDADQPPINIVLDFSHKYLQLNCRHDRPSESRYAAIREQQLSRMQALDSQANDEQAMRLNIGYETLWVAFK